MVEFVYTCLLDCPIRFLLAFLSDMFGILWVNVGNKIALYSSFLAVYILKKGDKQW